MYLGLSERNGQGEIRVSISSTCLEVQVFPKIPSWITVYWNATLSFQAHISGWTISTVSQLKATGSDRNLFNVVKCSIWSLNPKIHTIQHGLALLGSKCLTASSRRKLTEQSLVIQLFCLLVLQNGRHWTTVKSTLETDLHGGDGVSVLLRCWLLPCYHCGHSIWWQWRHTWQAICIQDRHRAPRNNTSTFSCQVNSTFCETKKQKSHYKAFLQAMTVVTQDSKNLTYAKT